MKTFKFSLVLRTRENTDVFITRDENIYDIHSKSANNYPLCMPNADDAIYGQLDSKAIQLFD